MISVAQAQAICLELAHSVRLATETLPLAEAAGRTLANPARATRAQPPFDAAAMDGYAVAADAVAIGARFTVVGESAAGHGWTGTLLPGQAIRIFTGAPVPSGANAVVIQEDIARDGDRITLQPDLGTGPNIRPKGTDFGKDHCLSAPRILGPADLALLAAMNVGQVTVYRRPTVALLATGDELVMPGAAPKPNQIIASNVFALKAMIEAAGGSARMMPIAPDNMQALLAAMTAMSVADLQITIGGASVGDHDLVAQAAQTLGVTLSFHKIAMRPGKPLIAGQTARGGPYLGLPGNPVSAIVCGQLFVLPMIRQMLGQSDVLPRSLPARLTGPLAPNGARAHYMRARCRETEVGRDVIGFDQQDSSMLSILAEANCLLLRPPDDAARAIGEMVQIFPF